MSVRPISSRFTRRLSLASVACASWLAGCIVALPASAQTSAAAGVATASQTNTLDFANARLADVIRTLATMLGRTIVLSDVPDARVTFSTAAPFKPADVESILESLLESYGLMLVSKGAVSQVVSAEKAPATGVLRSGFEFPDPPPLGLVSQLVPLTSIRADEGADALRAIVSKGARVEVVAPIQRAAYHRSREQRCAISRLVETTGCSTGWRSRHAHLRCKSEVRLSY